MAEFTIDDLEVEAPKEGFVFKTADGSAYTLQDPKALHLDELMDLEELSPRDQVLALIADEKFEEFIGQPEVDGYLFEALMKKYATHFGLGSLGNAESSRSSAGGSPKRSRSTSRGRGSR